MNALETLWKCSLKLIFLSSFINNENIRITCPLWATFCFPPPLQQNACIAWPVIKAAHWNEKHQQTLVHGAQNEELDGGVHMVFRTVLTCIDLLQKSWSVGLHGEITGGIDLIQEVIWWYIWGCNFSIVREHVAAHEEAESSIIKLEFVFPPIYALQSHWYLQMCQLLRQTPHTGCSEHLEMDENIYFQTFCWKGDPIPLPAIDVLGGKDSMEHQLPCPSQRLLHPPPH